MAWQGYEIAICSTFFPTCEAWSESASWQRRFRWSHAKDAPQRTLQEKSVAQELGSGVLYSDSMCAASGGVLTK